MSAEVHVISGGKQPDNLVETLAEKFSADLSGLLINMLNGADDMLFSMAEKAPTQQEQQDMFEAMRILRLERNFITKAFSREVKLSFRGGEDNERPDTEMELAQLSLVGHDELEEEVAIAGMTSKAENLYKESLSHLEARFEWLAMKQGVKISQEAGSPREVGMAFKKSIKNLKIPIQSKLLFYKLFDREVLSKMGDAYANLNEFLIEKGVLPKIKPNYRANSAAAAAQAAPASGVYGRNDILSALAQVQAGMAAQMERGAPPSITDLKGILLSQLRGAHASGALATEDERIIETVHGMFDGILGDKLIPETVKPLISQLQLPAMRAALLDKSFLTDKLHPARLFVNEVAALSAEARDKESDLYHTMSQLIENVSASFDKDASVFGRALAELKTSWEDIRKRFLGDETDRAREREEALRQRAKTAVLLELRQEMKDKVFPEGIRPLILNAWAPLMIARYIKYGMDTPQWNKAKDILVRIVASVQPINDPAELWARIDEGRKVVQEVRDELAAVKFDEQKKTALIDALQNVYLNLVNMETPKQDKGSVSSPASSNNVTTQEVEMLTPLAIQAMREEARQAEQARETKAQPVQVQKPVADKPLVIEVPEEEMDLPISRELHRFIQQQVKPGVWFQIFMGDGLAVRRLKVLQYDVKNSCIEFCNRTGEKVIDKDAAEFAKELKDGQSKPIFDDAGFRKALGDLIKGS